MEPLFKTDKIKLANKEKWDWNITNSSIHELSKNREIPYDETLPCQNEGQEVYTCKIKAKTSKALFNFYMVITLGKEDSSINIPYDIFVLFLNKKCLIATALNHPITFHKCFEKDRRLAAYLIRRQLDLNINRINTIQLRSNFLSTAKTLHIIHAECMISSFSPEE